ncbi:hypothetical protein L7F22_042435 [Adiantum nelumboides]|nr:hypothetical protein [Adiantum nelumboides]
MRSSSLHLLQAPQPPSVSSYRSFNCCSAILSSAAAPWKIRERAWLWERARLMKTRSAFCTRAQSSTDADLARAVADKGSSKPFIITTPLYYVNASPHMGSAYPTIAADALSRFQRLQGEKVIFITGTDEHGEKIALAAAANGRAPKDHCDVIAEDYKSLWKDLDISYDKFVRTTNSRHEKIVDEFYRRVYDKGDIYRADFEGLYCINCEEFKEERDLLEHNCCPIHRKPCDFRKEDNFFFALSKYQKELDSLLSSDSKFVQPSFRLNEVIGWVKDGVRDFSISRAAVEWGIPVPTDMKQTIYVWFDALLGYVSALLPEDIEPTLENAFSGGWPASVHIIGKDILRFHAVYWPAMLMSAGFPLPQTVFGHGFLTKDGLKMGKSLGNTIEPRELVSKFGSDAVRYYFLKEIEFGRDGDYSEERFIKIVNANLANTIGNLLNRTIGLLKKNCNSRIGSDSLAVASDNPVKTAAEEVMRTLKEDYSNFQFSSACEKILSIATTGNVYIDDRAPWFFFKKGGKSAADAAQDLVIVLEAVRIVAVALSPVTPQLSLRIYLQLGYSVEDFLSLTWDDTKWGALKEGRVLPEPQPVFKKIEVESSVDSSASSRPQKKKKQAKEVSQSAA